MAFGKTRPFSNTVHILALPNAYHSKSDKGPVVLGRAVTSTVTVPQQGRQKKDGKKYCLSTHFTAGD